MQIDYSTPQTVLDSALACHREGDKLVEAGQVNEGGALIREAEKGYHGCINRRFKEGMALTLLATMDQRGEKNGRALALVQVALAHLLNWLEETPDDLNLRKWIADAHSVAGFACRAEGYRDDAEKHFKAALDYGLDHPETILAYAGLFINDGQPQKCIDLVNEARKKGGDVTRSESWNLGLAHLELGHWHEGFRLYHEGVLGKQRLNLNYWARGTTPLWDATPDQTVVVYGEQGVGDEIMFASCLPELIKDCKHVIFDCHPRLVKLFERSFPSIEIHGTRKTNEITWAADRDDIDACIPIGSLPMFYRKKDADFTRFKSGYLAAHIDKVRDYRKRLEETGPGPYIGVSWNGGTKRTRFDLRSISPATLKPVLDLDATFISLNYKEGSAKTAEKAGLVHWQEAIDDLDEMAALVYACDFVVSVNQTLVHQAGALGVPAYVLTPARPAWRYGLEGSKMIWYPSVRQYRQRMVEEPSWAYAIERLRDDLKVAIARKKDAGDSRPRPKSKTGEERAAD